MTRFRRHICLFFLAAMALAGTALLAGGGSLRVYGQEDWTGIRPDTVSDPQTADAFMYFTPGSAGNCSAPANGGVTTVGCRFVLDMFVNAGTNIAPNGTTAQQSYLTFTNDLIKVARVSTIVTSCTVTNTITNDSTIYDAVIQNQVCNGPPDTPENCVFRGFSTPAGTIAWSNCALGTCPEGCPDPNEDPPFNQNPFRIARIGLCAVAPGLAVLHWRFDPPNDTQIVNYAGEMIQDAVLFNDYVIHIVGPTPTPAPLRLLVGHVAEQGCATNANPLTLTLKMGAMEVNYGLQTPDASGFFTANVTSLPGGMYQWRTKGMRYLANVGMVVIPGVASTTQTEMGVLRVGDVNRDDLVNINDFNLVKQSFGLQAGDADYNPDTEFTCNSVVNIQDLNYVKMNFGQTGAPPIRPRR